MNEEIEKAHLFGDVVRDLLATGAASELKQVEGVPDGGPLFLLRDGSEDVHVTRSPRTAAEEHLASLLRMSLRRAKDGLIVVPEGIAAAAVTALGGVQMLVWPDGAPLLTPMDKRARGEHPAYQAYLQTIKALAPRPTAEPVAFDWGARRWELVVGWPEEHRRRSFEAKFAVGRSKYRVRLTGQVVLAPNDTVVPPGWPGERTTWLMAEISNLGDLSWTFHCGSSFTNGFVQGRVLPSLARLG